MVGVSRYMLPLKICAKSRMMTDLNEIAPRPLQPLSVYGVLRITGFETQHSLEGGDLRVNVGSMVGRSREMMEMVARRKVDICRVQEV